MSHFVRFTLAGLWAFDFLKHFRGVKLADSRIGQAVTIRQPPAQIYLFSATT